MNYKWVLLGLFTLPAFATQDYVLVSCENVGFTSLGMNLDIEGERVEVRDTGDLRIRARKGVLKAWRATWSRPIVRIASVKDQFFSLHQSSAQADRGVFHGNNDFDLHIDWAKQSDAGWAPGVFTARSHTVGKLNKTRVVCRNKNI